MGVVSKIISTVRKIDGIYTMMEDAVKKINEVYIFVDGNRHLVFPESTLIYERYSAGAYEFTVPDKYRYVMIEYAGAAGGAGTGGNGVLVELGRGAILKIGRTKITNRKITGVLGAIGTAPTGGAGYHKGNDGTTAEGSVGGGGGGSSSVVLNGKTYEASSGAGQSRSAGPLGLFGGHGGNGVGPYAGKHATKAEPNNSVDATDPNRIGLNSGDGYVKIYGLAG